MAITQIIVRGAAIAALLGASIDTAPASAELLQPTKAVCAVSDADAALTRIVPTSLPPFAAFANLSGVALVKIDVDARGIAHDPAIVRSTGYSILDQAALESALEQTYSPATHHCENVAGSYAVEIDFSR